MADIFFTYAPDDLARVAEIAKALEAQGLSVDWAREILPGQNRVTEMTRRLAEARAVVVVWSARSVMSSQVLDEASAARDQGKLVPVTIDRIEPPLGFRQLHTSDLTAVGTPAMRDQLALLAQALKGREGAPATPGAPRDTRWGPTATAAAPSIQQKFLWTGRFWRGTGLMGLLVGLVWFLTPDSAREMGAGSAERFGYLIGVTLAATAFVMLGRILCHLSRVLVGKRTERYFDLEFLIILGLGLAFGALVATTPDQAGQQNTGVVVDLMSGLIVTPGIAGVLLLIVRGGLRLARGKPS